MSKKDKQRHLRHLVCNGCFRHCMYKDFRAHGRYAGGLAPKWVPKSWRLKWAREKERRAARESGEDLPHGNIGKRHEGQLIFAEQAIALVEENKRHRDEGEPGSPIRLSAVLGQMYRNKMSMWDEFTNACQLWGDTWEEEEDVDDTGS